MKPDAVMLFAAGFGTRMGALTRDCPKPLIEVAGKPLIDHALALAQGISPSRIVANLHYLPDRLVAHLRPRGVALSLEVPEILDTGGGLRAALPLLGEGPVFTLNTDAVWDGPNPLDLLRAAWQPDRMDALLVCVPIGQTLGRSDLGDFALDDADHIRRGPGFVYGGAQIIRTEALADFVEPAFSLNLLWDRMQAQDRLFGLRYPGRWCDVGHPDGIALAETLPAHGDV